LEDAIMDAQARKESGFEAPQPQGGIPPQRIAAARRWTLLALAVWLGAAIATGAAGALNQPGRVPVVLAAFLAIPIAGFGAAHGASPAFRAFTQTIPLSLLVGSHLWRFVGLGFILGAITGVLPGGFGYPEGIGDVIAALGALILLPMVRRGTAPRGWLLAWNAFGLLDLLSAITMGVLYSESALGVLHTAASNTRLMTAFPVSLIPTFFVPLFILVHALIFRRLERRGGSPAPTRVFSG
jgi:hypothetical protein